MTITNTITEAGDLRLSVAQVAQLCGYSSQTISRLRREGGGPPHEKLANGRAVYRLHEVQQWLAERGASAQG